MSRGPCAELAELRSAFVDGALTEPDRDRLLIHLVGCESCRRDINDLRAIQTLVSGTGPTGSAAPADLSQRLVSIAGADYDCPLRSQPFRRTPHRGLPSGRRTVRIRATVASVAVGAAVAMAGVTGYTAAPPELAAVTDPMGEAGAEFSSALAQLPLSGDSLGAVTLADAAALDAVGATYWLGPQQASGPALTADQAQEFLRRASEAANEVSFAGQQSFTARGPKQTYSARIQVVNQPGQGSNIQVLNAQGQPVVNDFAPAAASSRMVDTELVSVLGSKYTLSGQRGAVVAGRSAVLVDASRYGTTAIRWWLDEETGVVLWRSTFDRHGVAQLSSGFTSVRMNIPAGLIEHLPARYYVPTTNVTLSVSNADRLGTAGWDCRSSLAGLSLVKLRADRTENPAVVHLVYSDGVSTVTVYEQHGRLAAAPIESQWDESMRANVQQGAFGLATWQSGDTVFTVMTDGSAQLLAQAVAVLPHEGPHERTTMEAIRAGWAKILADMKG
ncbi:MAG TPA: zf-HC2 domain-containing protein [Propionibacteriaceae bacterium]